MLQIVKADLTGILALFADYRPQLDPDSLALDIRKLERQEDKDYLFLARREKSYLFPVEDIYLAESYANLCWTAYLGFPGPMWTRCISMSPAPSTGIPLGALPCWTTPPPPRTRSGLPPAPGGRPLPMCAGWSGTTAPMFKLAVHWILSKFYVKAGE